MMWWGHGPSMWGSGPYWWVGGLMALVFWAVLIAGVVWVVRAYLSGPAGRGEAPARNRAIEILEERFARGEITAEELRRMREELRSGRSG